MSAKKSVEELKATGGWEHMSRREQQRRIAEEKMMPMRRDDSSAPLVPTVTSYVYEARPPYPSDLTPQAKGIFKRLCKLLEGRGVLSRADGELLRLFAILADRHRRAMAHVQEEGEVMTVERTDKYGNAKTITVENKWLLIAERAERQLITIAGQCGLSPSSRDRIKVTRRMRHNWGLTLLPDPTPESEHVQSR